ncbi:MAG TPA: biotin--[acetyl-CoA-carboxylase] ligase [Candidatus Baltobacteraceae bacterium]
MDDDFAAVERLLAGSAFSRVRHDRETGSTNEDAAALLGQAEARGLTIVADYQQRGAGRKGRTWVARPEAALLFTTILPEQLPAADLWVVPFWTALAVRAALAEFGIPAALHWPNDLLVDDAKICGILCVSRVAGERAWVGCGVGVNVTRWPQARDIVPPPAFCDDIAPVDRASLLGRILTGFDRTLDRLHAPDLVARAWERAAGIPGARYRILRDGEVAAFEATAAGLERGGALLVEREGRREAISLADARALR